MKQTLSGHVFTLTLARLLLKTFWKSNNIETVKEKGKETDHTYDEQKAKVELYGIENNSSVVCVRWEEEASIQYCIIRVDYSGISPDLKCSSCKEDACKHVKAVLGQINTASDILSQVKEALNLKMKWRSRYVPQSVSTQPIPFSCFPEEQKLNRQKVVKEDVALVPQPSGVCDCGSVWGDPTEEIKTLRERERLDPLQYFVNQL